MWGPQQPPSGDAEVDAGKVVVSLLSTALPPPAPKLDRYNKPHGMYDAAITPRWEIATYDDRSQDYGYGYDDEPDMPEVSEDLFNVETADASLGRAGVIEDPPYEAESQEGDEEMQEIGQESKDLEAEGRAGFRGAEVGPFVDFGFKAPQWSSKQVGYRTPNCHVQSGLGRSLLCRGVCDLPSRMCDLFCRCSGPSCFYITRDS